MFLEIGPKPDLLSMGRRALAAPDEAAWIPSLQKSQPGWDTMLDAAAALFVQGATVDWERFDSGRERHRVALPCYPFERRRFWIDQEPATPIARESASHPLLGWRLPETASSPDTCTWQSSLSLDRLPYLAGHSLSGTVVLPYAALVEMALAAVGQVGDAGPHRIVDLRLLHPIVLSGMDETLVQVALDRIAPGTWRLRVYNRDHSAWIVSASASLLAVRTDDEV
jgi:acyl transferase domain-containing protein